MLLKCFILHVNFTLFSLWVKLWTLVKLHIMGHWHYPH